MHANAWSVVLQPQGHVPERREPFLKLTFDGGRFAGHALPVDVLAELATFQRIIEHVARHLFFRENSDRKRVPHGFPESARLYLSGSEANCFTAELNRMDDGITFSREGDGVFERAREVTVRALQAASQAPLLPLAMMPDAFPREGFSLLADLGRRLHDDETLLVRGRADTSSRESPKRRASDSTALEEAARSRRRDRWRD